MFFLYFRKLEEVEEFIEHAKLKNDDISPESQVLYFADVFEDYKLLELNSDVLGALKENQQ